MRRNLIRRLDLAIGRELIDEEAVWLLIEMNLRTAKLCWQGRNALTEPMRLDERRDGRKISIDELSARLNDKRAMWHPLTDDTWYKVVKNHSQLAEFGWNVGDHIFIQFVFAHRDSWLMTVSYRYVPPPAPLYTRPTQEALALAMIKLTLEQMNNPPEYKEVPLSKMLPLAYEGILEEVPGQT